VMRERLAGQAGTEGGRVSCWIHCVLPKIILSQIDKIDKMVGFHDATRLATLQNSAMPGPLTPRHKCAASLSLSLLSLLRR
jgi:hypothetical protein